MLRRWLAGLVVRRSRSLVEAHVAGDVMRHSVELDGCRTVDANDERTTCMLPTKMLTGINTEENGTLLLRMLKGASPTGVIYVPYFAMKVNPTSWMFHASKFDRPVKSRDLHWSIMATPRDSTGQVLPPSDNDAPMTLASLRCVDRQLPAAILALSA
uniref:Uncharacterized protein n=1 Tax=Panagrellus redivivus TaxID=6233 RepID=A0A7E4VXR9_PANRE